MILSILGILEAALSIWQSKLRDKYINEVNTLKQAYYEETNKPVEERSDAVLDNIKFKLRICVDSLTAQIKLTDPSDLT